MIKKILGVLAIFFIGAVIVVGCREQHPRAVLSLFPMKNYNQTLTDWIKPSDPGYDQALIPSQIQQQRLATFYKHAYGELSPWNPTHIHKILQAAAPDDLKTTEKTLLDFYNNKNKPHKEIGYGENFRPYSEEWIHSIAANIDLSGFDQPYSTHNRGIAIDNLSVRALPTDDPLFYHYKIAGQGYPFDNLQISALWAGTPVYILLETRDRAWSLVVTSDFIGWVKSTGIARTDENFIKTWVNAAFKQLAAITVTKTSVVDAQHVFHFLGYVGSVFPVAENTANHLKILIPIQDSQRQAVISYATLSKQNAAIMPLAPTPHNYSILMSTLLGRPYGWGNLYFYNDCSSELKNLMTPFGIWLPRHSSDQVFAGKMTDLSDEDLDRRIEYLMEKGERFTTIVYIDGHVFLYIGNYPNPNSSAHEMIPMTYQDMWGLRPKPGNRRAVIGMSVLFPLLKNFPEDTHLISQASKPHFQMSQLGETANLLQKIEVIDLHDLMYP